MNDKNAFFHNVMIDHTSSIIHESIKIFDKNIMTLFYFSY